MNELKQSNDPARAATLPEIIDSSTQRHAADRATLFDSKSSNDRPLSFNGSILDRNNRINIGDAIAIRASDEGEEHRNDKNDRLASFTFQNFRRDLSVLRRSQHPSSSEWLGDSNSSISEESLEDGSSRESQGDGCDMEIWGTEEEEEEESLRDAQGDETPKRRSMLSKSTSWSSSTTSVASFTLGRSRRRGGIRASLVSSKIMEIAETMRLENVISFTGWARSFYHLDPRWMILSFFNDLALEGMVNLKNMGGIIPAAKREKIPFILRQFSRAGVFSVWRPTSKDAIKKIMTGEGVGKGLDIKGKSALKGRYSGFVPFLQIHKNEDKDKVCSMTTDGRVRIFYPNQSSRDEAARLLKRRRDMMIARTSESLKIIEQVEEMEAKALMHATHQSFKDLSAPSTRPTFVQMKQVINESKRLLSTGPTKVDRQQFQMALEDKHRYMTSDPRMHKIDDYASENGVYGLDIPEKLFWEGFVVNNDITREEGSEHDTGRPSMPEFQTMNVETLRKHSNKRGKALSLSSELRPVLYHMGCGSKGEPSENSNPLCPLGLLMAYEENNESYGKVTPVVSDFDCFLVGTRGVGFHVPLGEQEVSMLSMCVDEIEGILSSPQVGSSWTKRWLEVKKKQVRNASSSIEMPKFGYADPTSYTMMKGAVHRLRKNGAVRHGPECFNYGFPQDLDGHYLVICDTLPGKVPWKYVNTPELISILNKKIDEGYTFPMNPKWILCDPGWKILYDRLWACDKPNVQESMNIWYPKDIRERIREISTKFPHGFVQCKDQDHQSSGVSVDLAEMELRRYQRRRSCLSKVKSGILEGDKGGGARRQRTTLFSTTLDMLQIGREVDREIKKDEMRVATNARQYRESWKEVKCPPTIGESNEFDGREEGNPKRGRRQSRRSSLAETVTKNVLKSIQQKLLDL